MDWVQEHYGDLHGVHTVNNALVVIGSLIFGETDFHQSICRAVEGGWDTDCNGATSGSIVGAAAPTIEPEVAPLQSVSHPPSTARQID